MKLFSVIAVGVLALCTPIVHAVDFADFKTCAQCIDAGFGWCPIQRMCGGFANTNCGEGENYWRKDYVPGKGKGKKGKKGKKASDSKPVYLTGANMTKTLEESDRFWVVKFSNTDGNDEDLKTLAKTVRGIAKVAHVDFSDDASSGLKNTHASGVTCFIKGATHVHPSTSPSLANTLEWLYSLVSKTISERTQ